MARDKLMQMHEMASHGVAEIKGAYAPPLPCEKHASAFVLRKMN
jgi:hypothetical protein